MRELQMGLHRHGDIESHPLYSKEEYEALKAVVLFESLFTPKDLMPDMEELMLKKYDEIAPMWAYILSFDRQAGEMVPHHDFEELQRASLAATAVLLEEHFPEAERERNIFINVVGCTPLQFLESEGYLDD